MPVEATASPAKCIGIGAVAERVACEGESASAGKGCGWRGPSSRSPSKLSACRLKSASIGAAVRNAVSGSSSASPPGSSSTVPKCAQSAGRRVRHSERARPVEAGGGWLSAAPGGGGAGTRRLRRRRAERDKTPRHLAHALPGHVMHRESGSLAFYFGGRRRGGAQGPARRRRASGRPTRREPRPGCGAVCVLTKLLLTNSRVKLYTQLEPPTIYIYYHLSLSLCSLDSFS